MSPKTPTWIGRAQATLGACGIIWLSLGPTDYWPDRWSLWLLVGTLTEMSAGVSFRRRGRYVKVAAMLADIYCTVVFGLRLLSLIVGSSVSPAFNSSEDTVYEAMGMILFMVGPLLHVALVTRQKEYSPDNG